MMRVLTLSRPAVPFLLLGAVLMPGCGSDSPTTASSADRSAITLTVDPSPLTGTQDPLYGSVTVNYNVTLQETNGLGAEVIFISSSVFDPATGQLKGLEYFDGVDLMVSLGTKRIEAAGKMVVPQRVSYSLPDLSKAATLVVAAQVKDDHAHLTNLSVLVKIE